MSRPIRAALGLALVASLASASAFAGPNEDARAQNAVRVLTDIQAIPESAIPDKLFDEARAVIVIPDAMKLGLVVGGRRGHGLLSIKGADGTWSNPAFVTLTGGSIGLQAGVQSADIVLVFRSDRGLDSIVNGKFTLGADAGVAAGPVGRNASAATDGAMKAEIWSWSRARGLFAGVALDGAVLSIDDAADESVYGRDTTPRMIFESRAPQAPSSDVVSFRDALEEASATARARRSDGDAPAPQATTTVGAPVPVAPAASAPATTGPASTTPLPETTPPPAQ
ncbi:lipid-binding SYLF domain-containing protein [Pseudoluteimonas lycopersici]|uniref:Lipid-binding SYLF domain-containing protein n=1 Tax=Pseudoluteimonas lycopersici TaxID=1324796 RepID=A0A516V6J5_9GAMM|nr:lipid-binding SYLF domain-containing protein [Lysobacter lycopersici]QDQ74140.1 lipid-binding SYLF domain-containing protein [Lysobacter lycopersici]